MKVETNAQISHYFSIVYIMVWFAIVGPASSADAREEILAGDYMSISILWRRHLQEIMKMLEHSRPEEK